MLREIVVLWVSVVAGIITRSEVYLRKPNERGPFAIDSALKCLHTVEMDWLKRNEVLTRSSNLAIGYIHNDSFPAVKISEEYIKFKNHFATSFKNDTYQIRVFSSATPYKRIKDKEVLASILLIDYYVIITDEIEDIDFIVESYLNPAPSWNPGARFLILFNNITNQRNPAAVAKQIFEKLLIKYYVHKILLMYAVGVTNYTIHLLDPFDEKNCRKVIVENASSCDNGVIKNKFLFMSHLRRFRINTNLRNCTLTLCMTISQPFIRPDCNNGIEMILLEILRNKLEFDVSK